jgi:hypothetical protein
MSKDMALILFPDLFLCLWLFHTYLHPKLTSSLKNRRPGGPTLCFFRISWFRFQPWQLDHLVSPGRLPWRRVSICFGPWWCDPAATFSYVTLAIAVICFSPLFSSVPMLWKFYPRRSGAPIRSECNNYARLGGVRIGPPEYSALRHQLGTPILVNVRHLHWFIIFFDEMLKTRQDE